MGMRLKEPSGGMWTIGQVVISLKGKDAGRWYVVVGFEEPAKGARVLVADGDRYTVGRPKPKNPGHLQRTRWVLDEIERSILTKGRFDAGRFQALLTGLEKMNSSGEPVVRVSAKMIPGASSEEVEEIACQIKAKS